MILPEVPAHAIGDEKMAATMTKNEQITFDIASPFVDSKIDLFFFHWGKISYSDRIAGTQKETQHKPIGVVGKVSFAKYSN
ncbi:MAG: hypothetical protein D6814_11600 [Calditrichaeota bacterium]|nr:MAG: hypothetical protein D6814_11600 [Calditrichota bacterium]